MIKKKTTCLVGQTKSNAASFHLLIELIGWYETEAVVYMWKGLGLKATAKVCLRWLNLVKRLFLPGNFSGVNRWLRRSVHWLSGQLLYFSQLNFFSSRGLCWPAAGCEDARAGFLGACQRSFCQEGWSPFKCSMSMWCCDGCCYCCCFCHAVVYFVPLVFPYPIHGSGSSSRAESCRSFSLPRSLGDR